MIDIRALLAQGQAKQDEEHAAQEVAKRGNLRGGTAGAVGLDGKVYGECHRVALARLLGADKEQADGNRSIMFDAGNANEDSWSAKLKAAGCEFKREEEIAIAWTIPGTERLVTGRPDIVLGETRDGVFVPQHGLELKGVFSASTGVRVHVEGVPDAKHLAQAGFYSMALGIPYTLCYTNPSVIDVPYWAIKKLGAPRKIQPFYRMFEMRWTEAGVLEYRDELKTDWVSTQLSKDGIAEFYALIIEMEKEQELAPRPEGGYADGTPLPFDKCDYCSLRANCDNNEDSYTAWVQALRKEDDVDPIAS